MKRPKKILFLHKHFLIFVFVFLLLCVLNTIFSFLKQDKKSILHTPPSVNKNFTPLEKEKWHLYMKYVGSQKSYNQFKKTYDSLPLSTQHAAIHSIGELLYEKNGIDGVTICDDSFSYGCFHGFFGAAIQDTGLTKLKEMDEACIKRFGKGGVGCQHGIGHGLMAYMGSKNLIKALEACDILNEHRALGGCKNGVFMEYNFNTISHTKPMKVRKLDTTSPYAPCDELPDSYQNSCYYSQPQWWNSVYNQDYKKIGTLCQKLTEEQKEICFLATGSMAGQATSYNAQETLKKCNAISSVYENMLCKAGATWIYKAAKQHIEYSSLFCDSVPSYLYKTCVTRAQSIP